MGRLTAYPLILALAAALAPGPGRAAKPDTDPLIAQFAVCAGRFAGLRNTGWQAPGQRMATRLAYAHFSDLFDAVGPAADDQSPAAVALRAMRMRARWKTARLLGIARHGKSARRARLAAVMLGQRLRACETLLPE